MMLKIVQIIVAILLILSILVQNRGTGLTSIFGGEGNIYRARRGAEKNLFMITIILSIIFFGISFFSLAYNK